MRGNARTSRIAAYVASGALVVSGAVLAGSPAEAVTYDPTPANQAADWLSGELDAQNLAPSQYGGADVGLTIDYAYGLLSAGGHAATVTAMADAIQEERSYIEYTFTDGPDTYAGQAANATAKVMALFQTISPARTTVDGVNLQTRLESLAANSGAIEGRIVDASTKNGVPDGQDYANALGQSYAAFALNAAGSSEADEVTDFLLDQQCSSGYFRLSFSAKDAPNQGCVNGVDTPDTDATALAALQLEALGSEDPDIAAAIQRARAWLTSQQRCDGSFGGGTSTEGSNANSTGLAAAALGEGPAARQAAQALKALQVPQNAPSPLVDARGSIALDAAALAKSRTDGTATAATRDQFRRATAQAILGVKWFSTDPTPALNLTGPTGYVKAGSRPVLTATGAAAGTLVCTTGPGTSVRRVAGSAPVQFAVTVPAGTGTRVYTVRDPFGHAEAHSLRALGAKTLTVARSKYRIKRGRFVTATVKGLAAGELARVYYKGVLVRSGAAGPRGNFLARFKVGRAKGVKRIVGFGQFTDIRRGATTIKVVR